MSRVVSARRPRPARRVLLLVALVATLLVAPPLSGGAGAGPNATGPIVPTNWPYATTPQFPPTGPGTPGTVPTAGTASKGGTDGSVDGPTREGDGRGSPESGPCPSGVGTLTQPTSPVEPGDLFTPATDGFVGETPSAPGAPRAVFHAGSGTPTGTGADGAAQFRVGPTGLEQLRVQAHFWDDWQNGPQLAMARVWLESLTGSVKYDYPFWTFPANYGPQFKCYADDPSLGSNKFYFDWWVTVPPAIAAEPGFNVRFEVLAFNGASMLGADQNTLHVGPAPTEPGQQVLSALALALDDSAVVDTNGAPDDAESVLKAQLLPAVNGFLGGLAGTSSPLNNDQGEKKGDFVISQFTHAQPTLDLSLRPTSTGSTMAPATVHQDCWSAFLGFVGGCWAVFLPGGPVPSGPADDEHRLWITATLPDFDMHGNVSWSPIGADYHVSGDLTVVLSVALDVDPVTGGFSVAPDVRVEDFEVDLDDDLWIDIWQWFYDLLVNENKLENLIEKLVDTANVSVPAVANGLPGLATAIDAAVRTQVTRLDGILAGGLGVGSGGFGVMPLQFQSTCGPLGCDGFRAGNIGMWSQGIDLVMNTGATNTGDAGRYPKTYDPETGDTADEVHGRTAPNGQAFDVGLWADAALVNQILTSVGASGVLDVGGSVAGLPVTVRGEVAPMLIPTAQLGLPSPDDKPLTILWPNVQVDLGGPRFAVDVAVGVDATIDETTGHLVPSAAVGINPRLLQCPGFELICGFLANPDLQEQFAQWLGGNVIQPLLASSIGQVAIPQVVGIRVGGGSVASVEGNLAAFVDLAPVPRLSLELAANQAPGSQVLESVTLSALPQWYPGSGNYLVDWHVENEDGSVVYDSPGGGETTLDLTLPLSAFGPDDDGCVATAGVEAQVTVTRQGWTLSDSASELYTWFIDDSGICQ